MTKNFDQFCSRFLFESVNDDEYQQAMKMVNEAASKAGYNYKVYHGTNKNFNSFDPDRYLTDRDQFSGPGINTTTSKEEASKYGRRIIEAFVKSENPAIIKYNIFELLTDKERQEVNSALEESANVISRRLIDGSIEPYGSIFIIKSNSRLDLGFLENPPFQGKIDSKEKAIKVFELILNGAVFSLHHSIRPSENGSMTSYGTMNRKIIEILKRKGYDSVVMKVREDDHLHTKGAVHRTVFDPNQIKSADPVTYDDSGNIIPLSSRFDSSKEDIRY